MANLLPKPQAIQQARQKTVVYSAALVALVKAPTDQRALNAVAKAYSELSSAQWELEQVCRA